MPRSPELSEVERRLYTTVHWVRTVLILAVAAMGLGVLGSVLVSQNRAAQAAWYVKAQLEGWRYDREVTLREALSELEALYAELVMQGRPNTDGSVEFASWREGWRVRLNRVRSRYRLGGMPGFGRANANTEGSLRDLVSYLSSYERGLGDPAEEDTIERLEQAIRRCFQNARTELE